MKNGKKTYKNITVCTSVFLSIVYMATNNNFELVINR